MDFMGEDGIFPVWDNDAFRQTRMGLLTGQDLPDFCQSFERAPLVPKEVMILQVVLWLHIACGQKRPVETLRRYVSYYPLYLETMKKLSLPLISTPKSLLDQLGRFGSVLVESVGPAAAVERSRARWLIDVFLRFDRNSHGGESRLPHRPRTWSIRVL